MRNFELEYKSALGTATTMYACAKEKNDKEMAQSLELIFPELKESEDERIRKEMLNVFKQFDVGTTILGRKYDYTKWIAWLEKQGRQTPTNKAEPKFKVGDWITNGKLLVGQVTSFGGEYYHYMCDGIEQPLHVSNVHNWHLWTIQDTKDGDVLVCEGKISKNKNGQEIGIVKNYVGRIGGCDNCFETYCFIDWDGNFRVSEAMGSPDIHPATKEQRDLLFQKMEEAGYKWDAKKKELKKIESKFAASLKDDIEWNRIIVH